MFQVLRRFLKRFRDVLSEKKIILYAGIYMLLIWSGGSILFSFFEGTSVMDAFYWVVTTTTTVGYGDITPQTYAGKVISIIVMLSGIGVLGIFLASFADILIEESLKRRLHLRSYMEDHVVVFGWDKKIEVAVKELLHEGVQVVVLADVEDIPLEDKNLVFIRGDITDDENIRRTNIEKASSALISGKNDTETLLTAIAVEKFNSKIKTTCIVSDPKVISALEKSEWIRCYQQTNSSDSLCQGLFLSREFLIS
mgnify:CR=1 FL=1|jgi:voltage-gated potassium channel